MDITLVQAPIYRLPTAQRAAAIVYDGTCDLQLWRPPGPDRELVEAYGDGLQDALDKERERLGEQAELGTALRLHPGKLRCDFLIWLAGRPPHGDQKPSEAPDLEMVERLANSAIEFASERGVTRLAFGALGAGRGEAEVHERLAAVVRAAGRFKEASFSAGKPAGIEEVVVAHPSGASIAKAKRLVARLARTAAVAPAEPRERRTTVSLRKPRAPRKPAGLDPNEVERARGFAKAYDRTYEYMIGEWLMHPTFGIGRVEAVDPERRIRIKFEGGEEKTLIHAR